MKKVYLIATFVAIIAGIATYLFATQIEKKQTIENQPMSTVVVALDAIPANMVITADMVSVQQYITSSVVPLAATKLEDVVDKISRYPIVKGEQLVTEKLSAVGADAKNTQLSYQLKEGEYAYTIAVDSVQGVSGFISKGDYVDIFFTKLPNGATEFVTELVMENVKVLRISNFATNYASEVPKAPPITAYSEIVVSLTKDQILQLSSKLADSGSVRLALKPITSAPPVVQAETTAAQPAETTSQAS